MSAEHLVLAILIAALGSTLQGAVGFGGGVLAAPLLLLVDPRLVPGPLLFCSFILTALLARREWHAVRPADHIWSLPGRVLGTAVAVSLLRIMPAGAVEPVLGIVIIGAVALAASGLKVALTPRTLFAAGTLAGFCGTTSSVGGPPIALLYQGESGPSVRANLSLFFAVGVAISLIGLSTIGRFGLEELKLGLILLPGIAAGFLVSKPAARWLDRGWMRPAVLILSALAGLAVILKALFGR